MENDLVFLWGHLGVYRFVPIMAALMLFDGMFGLSVRLKAALASKIPGDVFLLLVLLVISGAVFGLLRSIPLQPLYFISYVMNHHAGGDGPPIEALRVVSLVCSFLPCVCIVPAALLAATQGRSISAWALIGFLTNIGSIGWLLLNNRRVPK